MDKAFMTGCDSVTEWQLPWFIENLKKHSPDIPIIFADFGISNEMLPFVGENCNVIIEMTDQDGRRGWMKKPHAMASSVAKKTCWLDTDCQVIADISDVFDHTQPEKLSMVEDRPWTKRREEKWHNSGVVAFEKRPKVLIDWSKMCVEKDIDGDQEVLHWMMGGDQLRRLRFIEDLPHIYNVLRLDILDNKVPVGKKVIHWTGKKGNDEIRRLMKNG